MMATCGRDGESPSRTRTRVRENFLERTQIFGLVFRTHRLPPVNREPIPAGPSPKDSVRVCEIQFDNFADSGAEAKAVFSINRAFKRCGCPDQRRYPASFVLVDCR